LEEDRQPDRQVGSVVPPGRRRSALAVTTVAGPLKVSPQSATAPVVVPQAVDV
jgi:hypothetical protein